MVRETDIKMEEQRSTIEEVNKIVGANICWSETIACTRCKNILPNLAKLLNHEKDCLRNYNAGRKAKREAEKKEKSTAK